MNKIIADKLSGFRLAILLNAAGFVLLTGILLAATYVAVFFASSTHAGMISLCFVGLLIVVGVFYQAGILVNENREFEVPWTPSSVSSYVMRREVMKVTGTAYVVSQFALSASNCLVEIARKIILLRDFARLNEDEVSRAVSFFQNAAERGNRFVPVSEATESVRSDVLKLLLRTEILWHKADSSGIKLGLSRGIDAGGTVS
jgi:hypothetical protein